MKLMLPILALALTFPLAACSGDEANLAPVNTAQTVAAELPLVTVYKSPTCGCCSKWADHMKAAGFPVETVDVTDLTNIKAEHGIPAQFGSCHTAFVDDYAVEGHVPADDVKRLLAERPAAAGLAVPGMPTGSPGMDTPGRRADRYEVLLVQDGDATVFARH